MRSVLEIAYWVFTSRSVFPLVRESMMIFFYSTNTILTSAMLLPGHVCQHTFQKAMALHNILFTMVNIRLLASSLERAIKVVKVSAQKAAQGAPRAETVAVHRAIMQMGLHSWGSFGPSWGHLEASEANRGREGQEAKTTLLF